jgi:hypothetical protein
LDEWLWDHRIADIRNVWLYGRSTFAHLLIGAVFCTAAAWIVGVTHRSHRRIVVPIFLVTVVMNQMAEFLPAVLNAAVSNEAWRKLGLDLLFVRLPPLLAGIYLVREEAPRAAGATCPAGRGFGPQASPDSRLG